MTRELRDWVSESRRERTGRRTAASSESVLASVPVALAKIPHLAGVDHHNGQIRSCQGRHQGEFQAARSLQHHHGEVQGGHAGNQFLAPCLVVREAPALARRAYANVHLSLSDTIPT